MVNLKIVKACLAALAGRRLHANTTGHPLAVIAHNTPYRPPIFSAYNKTCKKRKFCLEENQNDQQLQEITL
jgi:hypothetical protein